MGNRGSSLAAAIGIVVAWAAVHKGVAILAPWLKLYADLKCRALGSGIRWSGRFLRSMGAVDSAPRAEQDALLAYRVSCALADRFQGRGRDLSVLVIGGVIHLEGLVGSRDERAEAEEIAREVSGARILADDLRTVAGQRRDPRLAPGHGALRPGRYSNR